jgi:hypothetical protein
MNIESLSTVLLSRIVSERSQARINALRAAADDPRRSLEEANQMRVLASLFEAERSAVHAVLNQQKRND